MFSPGTGSRAGARVVNVFTATSLEATVLSAGFAGANRRRSDRCFSNATVLSGTACPTVLPACPVGTATPCVASTVHRRPLGTPSRSWTTRCAVRPSRHGMRWTGGGSHRLRRPCRGQLSLHEPAVEGTLTRAHGNRLAEAGGWTPRRPPVGAIRRIPWCHRAGRSLKPFWVMARVLPTVDGPVGTGSLLPVLAMTLCSVATQGSPPLEPSCKSNAEASEPS